MHPILDKVTDSKLYKKIFHSRFFNSKLYTKQHPLQFFLQQVKNNQFNRMDVIIRLLAIENYYKKNDFGWSLYLKMQSIRTGAKGDEPASFKYKFIQLIESIQNDGYSAKSYLKVNNANDLMDGAHRLACSIYFNVEQIWAKNAEQASVYYSIDWFKNHFDSNEVELIEQRYSTLISSIDLPKLLHSVFNSKDQNFGRGNFYQSFQKIGIDGQRPTQERFKTYNLETYINEDSNILDIGCNSGFFSIYSSFIAKKVDGIEINPTLVEVGSITRTYLNKLNCNFYCSDFNKYVPENKYDIIYSFAVHHWVGMEILAYFNKLKLLLNPGGIVVFESQNLETVDKDFDAKVKLVSNSGFKIVEQGRLKDDGIIERKFVIFKFVS